MESNFIFLLLLYPFFKKMQILYFDNFDFYIIISVYNKFIYKGDNISMNPQTNNVQSLDRALAILEILSESEILTLSEITARTGLTKSTVHRLLSALMQNGYIEKINTGEYRITLKLFKLGNQRIQKIDFINIAKNFAGQLSSETNETVHLVIPDNNEILYIDKFDSENILFKTASKIGKTAPIYSTAVGKALVASYSNQDIVNMWNNFDLKKFTDNTITDLDEFIKEIEKVRKNGYAFDNEENEYGTFCIGAAFYNYLRKPVGAVSLSTSAENPDKEKYINKVLICANRISGMLGY